MNFRIKVMLCCAAIFVAEGAFPEQCRRSRLQVTGLLLPMRELPRAGARRTAAEPAEAHITVLRQDARRACIVAAAGSLQGVRVGAQASIDGRLVGVVDVVAPALCRVRLLGSRALRLPVVALRREAGGERRIACGLLAAEGGRLSFTAAVRPDLVRRGDLVRVQTEQNEAGTLVGTVSVEGVRPEVARENVDITRGLDITGAARAADLAALYSSVPVLSILAPLGPDQQWLLQTASTEVHAGSPIVDATGACVGFIDEAGPSVHRARSVALIAAPLAVRVVAGTWETSGMLQPTADGSAGLRLEIAAPLPPGEGRATLFSAAGLGLVPRGLRVGSVAFRDGVLAAPEFVRPEGPLMVLEFGDRLALERLLAAP